MCLLIRKGQLISGCKGKGRLSSLTGCVISSLELYNVFFQLDPYIFIIFLVVLVKSLCLPESSAGSYY